ncbi:UNVERIFIED_CONTAM: hypothetical protein FKN15_027688 [Acipenser sinensis]
MRYCSTRGGVLGWDFQAVLFSGFAPDGGLFMPEEIPALDSATLRSWSRLSYTELVQEVCSLFIPQHLIPRADLAGKPASHLTQLSYTELVQEVCSLFIPQHLIPRADLAGKPASHLTQLSYTELVQEVCSLFIPQHLIPRADLAGKPASHLTQLSYTELVQEVCSLFIPQHLIPRADLAGKPASHLTQLSYTELVQEVCSLFIPQHLIPRTDLVGKPASHLTQLSYTELVQEVCSLFIPQHLIPRADLAGKPASHLTQLSYTELVQEVCSLFIPQHLIPRADLAGKPASHLTQLSYTELVQEVCSLFIPQHLIPRADLAGKPASHLTQLSYTELVQEVCSLFIPQHLIPRVDLADKPVSHLTQLSYTELVQEVCSLFIPQHLIPRADLAGKPASHLTQLSYTELVQEVCSLFIPQHLIPRADLADKPASHLTQLSYTELVQEVCSLFIPQHLIPRADLAGKPASHLTQLSYTELVQEVCSLFIPQHLIPRADLADKPASHLTQLSYTELVQEVCSLFIPQHLIPRADLAGKPASHLTQLSYTELVQEVCSLFIPQHLIPRADLAGKPASHLTQLSYTELVQEVCSLFIPQHLIPRADLADKPVSHLTQLSFAVFIFQGLISSAALLSTAFSRFPLAEVVRVARLKDGLRVVELWHGATLAFKDLAMSCVGQFLRYFLSKLNRHATIVVGALHPCAGAADGDTGSSAIESVRGMEGVDIIVTFPKGRCTPVQELQMETRGAQLSRACAGWRGSTSSLPSQRGAAPLCRSCRWRHGELSYRERARDGGGRHHRYLPKGALHPCAGAADGDTGSSAIESVRGMEGVDIIVTFPKGRCTPVQELQMETRGAQLSRACAGWRGSTSSLPSQRGAAPLCRSCRWRHGELSYRERARDGGGRHHRYLPKGALHPCAGAADGDTGSSAIESVRGMEGVDIIVTFPKGRCTPVQELQMETRGAQLSRACAGWRGSTSSLPSQRGAAPLCRSCRWRHGELSYRERARDGGGRHHRYLPKGALHPCAGAADGDTGSSAIESVRGMEGVDIIVTFPKGRCTPVQELQMETRGAQLSRACAGWRGSTSSLPSQRGAAPLCRSCRWRHGELSYRERARDGGGRHHRYLPKGALHPCAGAADGDTGSSAIESVRGMEGVDIIVTFPKGRCTPVQELQMETRGAQLSRACAGWRGSTSSLPSQRGAAPLCRSCRWRHGELSYRERARDGGGRHHRYLPKGALHPCAGAADGDTGSSAIESVRGMEGVDIIVTFPKGRCTPVQELQMETRGAQLSRACAGWRGSTSSLPSQRGAAPLCRSCRWRHGELSYRERARDGGGRHHRYLPKGALHPCAGAADGDTGSSAIESVRGMEGVDIIVTFPKGRCTPVQELQMETRGAQLSRACAGWRGSTSSLPSQRGAAPLCRSCRWRHGELSYRERARDGGGRHHRYLPKGALHPCAGAADGDTGSSAIESVRGMEGVDIIVTFPKGRCTPVQELQMETRGAQLSRACAGWRGSTSSLPSQRGAAPLCRSCRWRHGELSYRERARDGGGRHHRYLPKGALHPCAGAADGDTGSSAIESVRGMEGVDIIVTFPKGRCTPVQELQMTTVKEDNVHVFAADGTSDDIDVPIRKLFSDAGFVEQHGLMSLNSVNWARIMVQVAHFFYAYFQCKPMPSGADGTSDDIDVPIRKLFSDAGFVEQHGLMSLNSVNWARIMVQVAHFFYAYFQCASSLENSPLPEVEIVVPTGGAGNITAGCVAVKMGLPVRLVAVVNENDIIHRAVQLGDFSLSESVKHTLAPAIDIQDPYNMERVFWLLSGMDSSLMKGLMEEFYSTGKLRLPPGLHKTVSEVVSSRSVTDRDIVETMRRCWEENRYLLCPHSAVAVQHHYQQQLKHASLPRCCLATASAAKFQDAVLKAGLTPEIPAEIRALETMVTHSTPMRRGECWEGILREKIVLISSTRKGGNSV